MIQGIDMFLEEKRSPFFRVGEIHIRQKRLITSASAASDTPLVVDLDGALVRSDLLIETAFAEIGRRPHSLYEMLLRLREGKAALKHRLAKTYDLDPSTLPYDEHVLAQIETARAEGRPVYLTSASAERFVDTVAKHLGLFTGWFASDATLNLAGEAKAQRLVGVFGDRGFDYIGNDAADLPVWSRARKAIAIRTSAHVARRLHAMGGEVEHLGCDRPEWRTWAKLLRVHQYAKNALVFAPLLAAHVFETGALINATLAAIAFSLCASSVYLLNDLVDLQEDRRHRSKRNRPLASGAISIRQGMAAIPILFLLAMAVAASISVSFLAVLLGYFALTTAYSFALKRKMFADVITLAALYSIRVVGGAVAIDVAASKWLLAFCMAMCISLALIKRYVELAACLDAKLPDPANRDYRVGDLEMIGALAAAAGFNAVTILALYISSDSVNTLFGRPDILWLACPLLMYWIGRALMLARRREMDDDPIVFVLHDPTSLAAVGAVAVLAFAAV
jgi:4-hydroxybenzoate polyprenyltransferase/phosphoserine phosphatase